MIFMAWRNIWRNPVRSALTIGALAGSLVLVLLYAALMEGMARQMVEHATDMTIGHIQVQRRAFIDEQDLYATLPSSYVERIEAAIQGIHLAPRLYASALASTIDTSNGVMIKAVDPGREPRVTRLLDAVRSGAGDLGVVAGEAVDPARHNVLIGAQLAKNMKLAPGNELILVTQAADASIGNALYRVAGVLKPIDPGFDRAGVLMSVAAYRQLMVLEDGYHELSLRLDDPGRLAEIQSALAAEIGTLAARQPLDALGGVATVRNWREIAPAIADMLQLASTMIWIIGLIVVALAAMGMLNTMLMAVHERTREFGILMAIGMKKRWLLSMVLIESLFLALVSVLAGSIVGVGLVRWRGDRGIDFSASLPDGFDWAGIALEPILRFHLRPVDVLYACIMVIVITMLAALFPSWRVVRVKPAEVMR